MPRINVTPESEVCIVECLAVVYGMVNPSHIVSMPHITLQSLCSSMSIQVSLSLDHCTTNDMRGSSNICLKLCVTQGDEVCVVEGLDVDCWVVHPCHTLSMPHLLYQSLWRSISTQVSLSLDHCAITDKHGSRH